MFVCWSVPSSRDWPGSTSRSPGNGKARSRDSRPGAPASLQAGAARFPTGGFARTHVSAALQDVPSQPPPHLCGYVDFLRGQGRGGEGASFVLVIIANVPIRELAPHACDWSPDLSAPTALHTSVDLPLWSTNKPPR